MHGRRNRSVTAFTAAVALAAIGLPAAVVVTTSTAPTVPLVATSSIGSASGQLTLDTKSSSVTGSVTGYDGTTSQLPSQTLVPSKADCLQVGQENLLSIAGYVNTSEVDKASYANGSIGVAEKKTGTSCSQVSAADKERLVLAVGPDVNSQGLYFDAASLDLELKQSAIIRATAYLGTSKVATYSLFSGASRPLAGSSDYQCTGSADSGPDAGAADNCTWPIGLTGDAVLFDSLVLVAETGSFSLEGGSDGDPTAPSVFALSSTPFDCNTSRSLPASTGGTVPAVTGTRLANADSGDPCTPLRFKLSNGTGFAELLKPSNVDPSAQFVYDFTWTVNADIDPTGDSASTALVPRTEVDFDSGGGLDVASAIASCPDLVSQTVTIVAEDGSKSSETFLVVKDVATNSKVKDLGDGIPGLQFACIVEQAIVPISGTNRQTVTERIYAYGDILLQKR